MEFKEREFIPVLLGGDINTYSVARAFYQQYQVKSYVFGKYQTGPSFNSQITIYEGNPKIDTDDYFLERISRFAGEHKDKKILLIGCGDSYVALASRHKNELPDNVIAPYIDFDLMDSLQQKERFYQLCEKHSVDYPKTIVYKKEMGLDFACDSLIGDPETVQQHRLLGASVPHTEQDLQAGQQEGLERSLPRSTMRDMTMI